MYTPMSSYVMLGFKPRALCLLGKYSTLSCIMCSPLYFNRNLMEQRLDIGVSISLSVQCVPKPPPFLFRILFFFHSLLLLGLYTFIQELLSHVPCLRNTASAVVEFNSNFFIKGLQGTMAYCIVS